MTRYGSHTESRMRENCTYGSMRGRAYPITRGVPLYSTLSEECTMGLVKTRRLAAMQKQQRAKLGTPPVKKGGGASPGWKGRSGKGRGGK